ncbi:MAG TPA: HAMP domain-containing sensor histidine kinase [Longimicrobium sp.]|nr:HAMP domain-containing sensor histidine kinase [Longimicrobium sp.]
MDAWGWPDHGNDMSYSYRGMQVRDRLEALGQISAELLHDLADVMWALEARARLAAGEARMGRASISDLDRMAETSGETRTLLRDMLDALRGRAVSPEVRMDVHAVVERAVRRFLPGSRAVDVRLVSTLPGRVEVHGRSSFLLRAVTSLLFNAMRQARGEILVSVAVDDPRRMDEAADAVVRIDVEDDGAGLDPVRAAYLFEPSFDEDTPPTLSGVAWAVEQLGGWVRHRPGEDLGGACFEIRLPVAMAGGSLR